MSHEFEAGVFMRGLKAWHELGLVIDPGHEAEVNAMLALRLQKIDWRVSMHQCYMTTPGSEELISVPGVRAIVRDSDGRILGSAGNVPRGEKTGKARHTYVPFQNSDMAEWVQPILDAKIGRVDAVASLYGGQRVYMLVRLGHNGDSHAEVVPGDEVVNHWMIANSHDGGHSLRVGRCRTRIVCANTLAAAFGEGTNVRIRHTQGTIQTLKDLQAVMLKEQNAFSKDVDIFRKLAKQSLTKKKLREYVEAVFPDSFKEVKEKKESAASIKEREREQKRRDWAAKNAGKDLVADLMGLSETPAVEAPKVDQFAEEKDQAMSEILSRIEVLVESGRGQDIPGVRGTMWGGYNAVSEFLQYEYGRGPVGATEKRMDGMMFGAPATWNALALQKAMEFGKVGA